MGSELGENEIISTEEVNLNNLDAHPPIKIQKAVKQLIGSLCDKPLDMDEFIANGAQNNSPKVVDSFFY